MANYITKKGAKRLQEELERLWTKDRPHIVREVSEAAAMGDRSENAEYIYGKKKMREIDRRIQFLRKRLESAVVVTRPEERGAIFFGAVVVVEDEDGAQAAYRIVGEDEIDLGEKHISWKSPIGHALLKKKVGDVVTVRRPNGEIDLTVLSFRYPED